MGDLPPALRRSITWDQGTEMARHLHDQPLARRAGLLLRLALALAARLEREHQRAAARLLPEGHRPQPTLPSHLLAVENELNNRPRLVLNDQSPATLFAALLASEIHAVLRR